MTTALQITVLVVLCFGIPLAFLAMIRAHLRPVYDPDYISTQVAKAASAFADDDEDDQPAVRRFNKDGANVPPSGLHKPERAADLRAISAEILHISL